MLENVPKPIVIIITVVAVLVAGFFIYKSTLGGGENAGRPTADQIREMQKKAAGAGASGGAQPSGRR